MNIPHALGPTDPNQQIRVWKLTTIKSYIELEKRASERGYPVVENSIVVLALELIKSFPPSPGYVG